MNAQIPSQTIDDLMDVYVEWREACIALRSTYERWSSVRVAERESAFAEFRTALDREELASAVYADHITSVTRRLPAERSAAVVVG